MGKKYRLYACGLACMLALSGCQNSGEVLEEKESAVADSGTVTEEAAEAIATEVSEEVTEQVSEETTEQVAVETMWIDSPALGRITSAGLDELEVSPVALTKLSEERNEITDTEQWLYDNGFHGQVMGNTPGYEFNIRDEYDLSSCRGYILEVRNSLTGQLEYEVDLAAFRDPLTYEIDENYIDYCQVDYRFAYLEDDILYVSMAHRTYAELMPYTAFILAIDLKNGLLLWKSENLVSNALSFAVTGDVIICGYGFTDEEDYLYQLNKKNGAVIGTPIRLRTGPDYIFLKEGKVYVRTYNTNYVFTVDNC